MPTTVTSLEDRVYTLEEKIDSIRIDVHHLTTEYASFKAKVDTLVSLMRWIGVFVAGLVVTVIYSVISFAHSAGELEANVDRLREVVQKQEQIVQSQTDTINKMQVDIKAIQIEMKAISFRLNNIEEQLKKP